MASTVLSSVGRKIGRVWCSTRRHEFRYTSTRDLNSSSKTLQYSSVAAATAPEVRGESVHGAVNAPAAVHDFEGAEGLFSGLTTRELIASLFNLLLVSCEPVADLGMKALKSPLMQYAPYRVPILKAVKRTAFSHFCAGESVAEASDTLNRMWALGLKGILDYSLEDAADNAACDANLRQFLTTVKSTPLLPPGSVSFACVKMTAICPLALLERVSHLLRWQHRHPAFSLPWKAETLPVLAPSSPTHHTYSAPEPLSPAEENDLILAEQRLFQLCRACEAVSLPLLVDAEYTAVQPAIDYFIYRAFSEYNRRSEPLVYGTIQAYLKDSLPRLIEASEAAKKQGISMALKLVRGAYITRESAEAESLGAPSPVHSLITDTHSCYNACTSLMLEKVSTGEASLLLATHNFESAKLAAAKAEELGIMKRGQSGLQFAQLKGMSDSLSLGLVKAGFEVSKYLPFGPVESVMPYLIRRAEENRAMLAATFLDIERLRTELKRRILPF